ncbi:TPA: hypothetical protein ACOSSY_003962 [Escherichia coli]
MTENTEPSSPSHPAPDPEILKSTIRAMKQSEQRANNVPALIKALLCTGTCLLISITGNDKRRQVIFPFQWHFPFS